MKSIRIYTVLFFLAAMLGSVGASAAVVPTISSASSVTGINKSVSAGLFDNFWTFTLGSTSRVTAEVQNIQSIFHAGPRTITFQDISNLTISLHTVNLQNVTVYSPLAFSTALFDSNPSATSFSSGTLQAGSYALEITGSAIGVRGGKYSSSFAITPVPEPETWVMLLVGTILIGVQVRRKSVNQDSMLIAV